MKIVEATKPPVITIAKGRSISVPCMRSRRIGNRPPMALAAVISFAIEWNRNVASAARNVQACMSRRIAEPCS
jgi:hypothetical protein